MSIRRSCQLEICRAGTSGEQLEDGLQAAFNFGQSIACVPSDEIIDDRSIRGHRRRFFLQLAPRAGEREALDEQQVFDPNDLLDVCATVHPRSAFRLGDTKLRKLGFPRAQHVRLKLDEIAHLGCLEQRAIWNLDGCYRFGHVC